MDDVIVTKIIIFAMLIMILSPILTIFQFHNHPIWPPNEMKMRFNTANESI